MSARKISNSNSEEDHENRYATITDEKKRKRMISNRESARRSRMKREQRIKDLNDQTIYFSTKRSEMIRKIDEVTRRFGAIDSENMLLKMQDRELKKRLELLQEMLASYNNYRFMHDVHGMIANKDYSEINILMKTPFQPQAVDGIYQF